MDKHKNEENLASEKEKDIIFDNDSICDEEKVESSHADNSDLSNEISAKLNELEQKLVEAQKNAEEYKTSWYRTAADFDNYKKRNNEAKANAYADGKGDAIKSILVIGDNLDRALASAVEQKTREGIELVIRQFSETLKNLGVSEVNPVGEVFDPNVHEAVHQIDAEEGDQSGTVKQVFKKGYSLNGKMLRYAQVVVVK